MPVLWRGHDLYLCSTGMREPHDTGEEPCFALLLCPEVSFELPVNKPEDIV